MIRYIFFIACLSLINTHTFFAMHSTRKKNTPLSLDDQLLHFDQRMRINYPDRYQIPWWDNKKKLPFALAYIQKISHDLPDAIANQEVIKKYADNKELLFAESIGILVDVTGNSHYKNVTGDTLKTIQDTYIKKSCSELNELPYVIKKYVMARAYDTINKKYTIQFPKETAVIDIHPDVNLAATADRNNFFIWDLTTLQSHVLAKRALNGGVKFSSNGAQLVTVTRTQEMLQQTTIDIWNSQTRKHMHSIDHHELIQQVTLENKDGGNAQLFILDTTGTACVYRIDHTKSCLTTSIETGITRIMGIDSNLHYGGCYEYYHQTKCLTKKNIPFYLCKRAIKNTQNQPSLEKIKRTSLYLSLTPYEQTLIEKKLKERSEELKI